MSGADLPPLIPAQQRALREIEALLVHEPVVALVGERGMGKSTIIEAIQPEYRAGILNLDDYMAISLTTKNSAWDRALIHMIERVAEDHDVIVLDDFMHFSSRHNREVNWWGSLRFAQLRERIVNRGKRLILCGLDRRFDFLDRNDYESGAITRRWNYDSERTAVVELAAEGLQPDDYRVVANGILKNGAAATIDFNVLHDFAPLLNIHQLKVVLNLAKNLGLVDTNGVIRVARDFMLRSNLRRHEVADISFDKLPGTEAIEEALETHLIVPFEDPSVAHELGIRPRRGVMLFGPPGTGKTSIGRALARRLGGRFFLMDGSFVTEPPFLFAAQVRSLFKRVIDNSPSVLFIDDADLLFQIGHTAGLLRQLLSLLDGMESRRASKVCIMITAMDPAAVPDALLRSGRIELWLEMRSPGEESRRSILQHWSEENEPVEIEQHLVDLTQGFTPADLRRVAGDARLFRAADRASGRVEQPYADYMNRAAREIIAMREQMARVIGTEKSGRLAA